MTDHQTNHSAPETNITDWHSAYENERIARELAEKMLDEKTREVQNSLDVMQFHFDEVMNRNKELQILSSIASITHKKLNFNQCIELLLTSLSSVIPCIYAHAYLRDNKNPNSWKSFGKPIQNIPIPDFLEEKLEKFHCEINQHQKNTIDDLKVTITHITDTFNDDFYQALSNSGIKLLVTLPVMRNEVCVAIAEFGFLNRGIRESDHISIIETAGHQIGIAIERRDQEEQLSLNFNELKNAHDELKRAKNQLVQSEKMASIGQLSAGIAHEINNPVGFVLSNFGSLKDYLSILSDIATESRSILKSLESAENELLQKHQIEFDEKWKKLDIDFILSDLKNLAKDSESGLIRVREIVSSLKDFARIDNEKPETVQLDELIEKSIKLVWNEIKYTAKLQCSYDSLPPIMCNPRQISQVVVNLIVNASQAMKDSGTITVRLAAEDNFARIDVEDTGSGIPNNLLNKIFEPFFTTKPVGVGTGLGLSIAYGIMQSHNGRIEVKSNVGEGTCFSLFLPIDAKTA